MYIICILSLQIKEILCLMSSLTVLHQILDEGYFRNMLCELNLISTFLIPTCDQIYYKVEDICVVNKEETEVSSRDHLSWTHDQKSWKNIYIYICKLASFANTVELMQSDTWNFQHSVTFDKNLWSQSVSAS